MSQALSTPDIVPHDGQQEVLDSDAGTRVVIKGRQWGGTTLVAADTIEYASENADALAWAVAPLHDQARIIWRRICSMLGLRDGGRARMTVTLANGARIKCLGVQEARPKSRTPDYIAVDEADAMSDDWWKADRRLFVTTPMGYAEGTEEYPGSWVYDHFLDGFKVGTDTESWRFTTDDAPHTNGEYVAESRAQLEPIAAEREYDARWQ